MNNSFIFPILNLPINITKLSISLMRRINKGLTYRSNSHKQSYHLSLQRFLMLEDYLLKRRSNP